MNRQEAIRIVKNNWPNDRLMLSEALEFLIPELQESKDDKTWKMIRGWIYTRPSSFFDNGVSKEETLAWLEKQGEQKTADNIEPKFNVGDWIVYDGVTYLITGVYTDGYTNDQQGFIPLIHQDEMRLWDISKDARDGDVLVWNDCGDEYIFVFDKLIKDYAHAFIGFNGYLGTIETKEGANRYYQLNKLYPATKEQSDLLFQKMHEAGYKWDIEKKELRKIEQKPAWSEEDEEMEECVLISLEFFENLGKDVIGHPHPNYFNIKRKIYPDSIRNWLKSLKERMKGE